MMTNLIPILKALADETRFRLIQLLLSHDLCVGALADHLSMSKAAVSQHLQILRKAGLVRGEKRGYWTHYSVDKTVIHHMAKELMGKADQAPDFRMACHRSAQDQNEITDLKMEEFPMCQDCCRQPIQLKDKPEDCTPEQIRACHGDEKEHPCVPAKEEK